MDNQQVVLVEPGDVEFLERVSAENGVDAKELSIRGLEPVTTITFVLIGASAAVAAVVHLLERRKGGQVIDMRAGAPAQIYRSRDVVYGLVIIISDQGKVTVEVKEPKELFGVVIESLAKIVTDIGKAGIDSMAKAVAQQFGESVSVDVDHGAGIPQAGER